MSVPAATEGRRERNKRVKAEAILAAATELFTEKGYDAVTTSEIAERADVSNGTLFRYARTKADLLVTVLNERLTRGCERGVAMAHHGADPVEAIIALLHPLAETGLAHPEIVVAYQRELLFGANPTRDSDLGQVEQLQAAIAEILAIVRPAHGEDERAFAAYALYSTMYMDLVRVGVGRASAEELPTTLRHTIRTLLARLLPAG
ncbi:TetR/AcrR family transcriptional regulator [Gephyromycinifex aptenodytis]|uniref:TetR/AcrR family transcriptional regulator n=1 Tax=Gephyromycinifex aptenodytis TaxID=2716227 RepID=UPI001446B841|nr:TetR/AcrR family transcriptional regulator [Gephyromycinifex aptenodytis]